MRAAVVDSRRSQIARKVSFGASWLTRAQIGRTSQVSFRWVFLDIDVGGDGSIARLQVKLVIIGTNRMF